MCKDCGCSLKNNSEQKTHTHAHEHEHDGHAHSHEHTHVHEHEHAEHTHESGSTIMVKVAAKILEENDKQANENRIHFEKHNILAVNLMSSPGAGKTTLLEKTIEKWNGRYRIGVIEGDLETERDAERIRAQGVPAYQITTGQACHLDASMVHHGMHHLPLEKLDIVFIENVGNLVCPASYDTGAHINVVLLSTPEGDDKIAKYPVIFRCADIVLITKIDLLPYLHFSMDTIKQDIRRINHKVDILPVSSIAEDGINKWLDFLMLKKSLRNA